MNYLTLQPFSRINEVWVSPDIDSRPADKSVVHPIIQGKSNSFQNRYQSQFYQHIALDIVTETTYNYPYPFVSEKTLRPIACKRMFIVVGAPGILQLLRNKNFVTFGDVIDESYDLIQDPVLRWKKLEQAILNFVNQPLETIQKIVSNKSSVLEHNYQTLIDLEQTELKALHDSN
jgi:hypothetical protein